MSSIEKIFDLLVSEVLFHNFFYRFGGSCYSSVKKKIEKFKLKSSRHKLLTMC